MTNNILSRTESGISVIRETLYGCTFQCGEMFLCLKWSNIYTLFYCDIIIVNGIEKENFERTK